MPAGGDVEWLRLDAAFMDNDLHGPARGPSWLIEAGPGPVLFVAVHGVAHYRPGVGLKSAEARTGGLARMLAAATGTSAATVLRAAGMADANFDPGHPFKHALARLGLVSPAVAVIDLHGMTDGHPADIAIGRGPDAGLSAKLAGMAVAAFEAHGFEVDRDGSRCGLCGASPGTVTAFAQGMGAQAIQVEIARRNRTFLAGATRRASLVSAFRSLAAALGAREEGALLSS